jgi:hypothetical protein
MWGMKKYYLGHIAEATRNVASARKRPPCTECDLLGGLRRTLPVRQTSPSAGTTKPTNDVCDTYGHWSNPSNPNCQGYARFWQQKKICLTDFNYLKYNGVRNIP